MEEENLAKKLYQDSLLNGIFTNSEMVRNLGGRVDKYGENRQISAIHKGEMASDLVATIDKDQEVARGIAIGMELGEPIFEEYGEEFLKSKISNYKKSSLGVALTKVMLHGLKGSRMNRIIQGVEDAIEGKEDSTDEVRAAVIAKEIYEYACKFKDSEEYSGVVTFIFGNVRRITRKKGYVSTEGLEEELEKLKAKRSEKDIISRNLVRKDELEKSYEYYRKHFEEIPDEFVKPLEGYGEQEMIAYYVVSKKESELHKLYSEQIQDNEK